MDQEKLQQFTAYASLDQKLTESFSESFTALQVSVKVSLLGRAFHEFRHMRQLSFWLVSEITAGFFQLCAKTFIPARTIQLHEKLSIYLDLSSADFRNKWIIPSILAGEDHRFYFHKGADPIAIIRAVILTALGRSQGGSTIEQQLVRTVTGDYRRSLSRKYRELMLASTLVNCFSKSDILKIYCHVAYFGYGIIGMQAAEKKLLAQIQESDSRLAAILIAHLKFPSSRGAQDRFLRRREARILHIIYRVQRLQYWLNADSSHSS